jgi:DNA-directed RNA polymerase subunit M/transcription elongation factor TFIIS
VSSPREEDYQDYHGPEDLYDDLEDDEIGMAERLHWETCEVEGHEWVDRSRLGPDSGTEVHECLRCGYVWSHTWY